MSLSVILGAVWVILATGVALLPMRRQYLPGVILLLAAPVLIWLLWADHGAWVGVAAVAAFLSMFRNPLKFLVRRALGLPVKTREEIERERGERA